MNTHSDDSAPLTHRPPGIQGRASGPAILHWVLGDLRKQGSFESYLLTLADAAEKAGVRLHIVAGTRAHPAVIRALTSAGVEISCVDGAALDSASFFARQVRRIRPWLVHCHFGSPSTPFAAISKLLGVSRFVFTDHGSRSLQQFADRPHPLRQLRRRFFSRFIDLYLPVSEFVASQLTREVGASRRCVRRLFNGVDLRRFYPESDRATRAAGKVGLLGLAPGQRCVAYVGQLTEEKGIQDLLAIQDELLAGHPDVVFVWIGDGPMRMAVEARLSARSLYVGLRNDVDALLRHVDILVAPSRWHEAFCLTVAEGAACGVPAVATRIGGIGEVVEDGVTGLLVAPGDRAALKRMLDRLLNDEASRAAMSAAAHARAVELFSLDDMVAKTIEHYRRLGLRWPGGAGAPLPSPQMLPVCP